MLLPGFADEHCLVFVHIGERFPMHMRSAIEQARLFNRETPIYVLGNAKAIAEAEWSDIRAELISIESLVASKNHRQYIAATKMEGFWRYALERFFILDDFVQQYGLFNVFHLENDVMIYFDIQQKLAQFKKCYVNKVATVFDCDQRAVPSFVYIPNPNTSNVLSTFIAKHAHVNTTDMEMLHLFKEAYYLHRADTLPILIPAYAEDYPLTNIFKNTAREAKPFFRHLDELGMIFDAAALGQFLGGIDPILGKSEAGFMGEASVFLPMHFEFAWFKDREDRWIPHISYKGIEYPIANLHIHSKKLHLFLSKNQQMQDLPTNFYSSLPFDHIMPKEKSLPIEELQ